MNFSVAFFKTASVANDRSQFILMVRKTKENSRVLFYSDIHVQRVNIMESLL